ncbi:methylaspartate ammonia-lyase [Ruegeria sp.]|uniref:methylaspartate ammonia-lyase n=1 Tax=Ruegeria sp. TaxID=1879320 RepID=UPI002319C0B8|nr:methylaspartate ammonia-lyase [Ruegeria sp.]MDA7963677.1 methylaspartate ammonia-lyase [Ruegeria sp.]
MKITKVTFAEGRAGFYNEDLLSIKKGAQPNGLVYSDPPITPGFETIVQPGRCISVMLTLEDGSVGFGDCMDVIFSGQAGRDPLFKPEEHMPFLENTLPKVLIGKAVDKFRPLAEEIDKMTHDGRRVHTALRYGITQAILHATALANRTTIAEVVAAEYNTKLVAKPIPILANCEPFDHLAIDKAIVKKADLLPHGAFPQVVRDLGLRGEKLKEYTRKLVARIHEIGAQGYKPAIHYDLYGSAAELFDNDPDRMVDYFAELEQTAAPYDLYIESPAVMRDRAEQIEMFSALSERIRAKGLRVRLIADEWCNTLDDIKAFAKAKAADFVQVKTPDLGGVNNTIEALIYARQNDVGACLGGSANETDQSTRITTQIGLACDPSFMLSKPGFGCDESLMILTNEMTRTLALVK